MVSLAKVQGSIVDTNHVIIGTKLYMQPAISLIIKSI